VLFVDGDGSLELVVGASVEDVDDDVDAVVELDDVEVDDDDVDVELEDEVDDAIVDVVLDGSGGAKGVSAGGVPEGP
jgi:hypothetical protein